MKNLNILKTLYLQSPMNFYTISEDDCTVIKSYKSNFIGYKFNKKFSDDEISQTWDIIRLHKKTSTFIIFALFLILLYEIIFPKFVLFVNNTWYVNAILLLAILALYYHITLNIGGIFFDKKIKKLFGEFEKVIFTSSDQIHNKYYNLFKFEFLKVIILIILALVIAPLLSPFKLSHKLIKAEKYNEAIKVTSLGAKLFPIAQEWYSLRGYAKFKTKDFKGAIEDYDTAYKLEADGPNIMNFDNKIYIKYYLGEYDSAIKDFDKEISNVDSDFEKDSFLWDKAQFLYNIRRYEDALAIYTDLLIKAENDRIFLLKDRLYIERAEVYKKLGLDDLAQQDLVNSGGFLSQDDYNNNPIPKPVLIIDEIIK